MVRKLKGLINTLNNLITYSEKKYNYCLTILNWNILKETKETDLNFVNYAKDCIEDSTTGWNGSLYNEANRLSVWQAVYRNT